MPPTYPDGGRVLQLLRGGSWNNNPRNGRSAYRNHNQPDNANNNVGFRVACLPQLPSPSEQLQGIPTGAPEGSRT
jgi:formylglycine-generating enzyme required for sulfatase activity